LNISFQSPSCPQHSPNVLLLENPTCLLQHVVNCEENFPYFDLGYLTSGLAVARNITSRRTG
jgi:hypothetical protein